MMTTGHTDSTNVLLPEERTFWERTFSAAERTVVAFRAAQKRARKFAIPSEHRTSWIDEVFEGPKPGPGSIDKMVILKNGIEIHEVPVDRLAGDTVIGRHPDAHLQLEAYKLGLFHLVIRKADGRLYAEAIESEYGTLVERKKIQTGKPVPLRNGSLVDIPGFQLRFHLTGAQAEAGEEPIAGEELEEIPSYFYSPPPPPPSPVLINLIEDRAKIGIWSRGVAILRVADIVEETPDVKTFRLVGEKPMLFSYRPGQFITLLLRIDGADIERSYSISSSPSRPHVLEITVKRVAGGVVSNWLCDHVRLGQSLTVKGPAGRFSCFEYPAAKMLFIGAGSGITPLMSMSRWIADTTAQVDVKFLAAFRSQADIIYRKELELISARHNRFRVAVTLTGAGGSRTESWTGFTGRIDESMIRMLATDLGQRHVFLCGPEPFALEARRILRELGFDSARLHSESFGSPRVAQGVKGSGRALQLSGTRHRVKFTKSELSVETDETVTVLELAEAHGVEMNYSCRTGNCGECEMRFKGALSEKADYEATGRRKEDGLAYACCSVALSDLEVDA
jgi:ferredoxin-NADP reductase